MKKTVRNKWVTALRSGLWPQCHGNLRQAGGQFAETETGYCCLGVLCEIAANEGVVNRQYNPRSGYWAYGADTETGVLPREVVEWAGLTDDDPFVPAPEGWEDSDLAGGSICLTTVNDDLKLSFTEIADLIEANL